LNRKIEDLEDVRGIMAVLKEVREKESEIDNLIGPIEEMYALLLRYEVGLVNVVCVCLCLRDMYALILRYEVGVVIVCVMCVRVFV